MIFNTFVAAVAAAVIVVVLSLLLSMLLWLQHYHPTCEFLHKQNSIILVQHIKCEQILLSTAMVQERGLDTS